MADDEPNTGRRLSSISIRLPFVSFTLEGDILRRQTQQLRDEFTREKRDELFETLHSSRSSDDRELAKAELAYYLAMLQVISAERGTRQLAIGTWILAVATMGLFISTVVLVVVTATH